MKKRHKCVPGCVFAIPLRRKEGYVIGILSCRNRGGSVLFGYFLRNCYKQLPRAIDLDLKRSNTFLACRFGYSNDPESWPIIGKIPDFKLEDWPMLQLVTYSNEVTGAEL